MAQDEGRFSAPLLPGYGLRYALPENEPPRRNAL